MSAVWILVAIGAWFAWKILVSRAESQLVNPRRYRYVVTDDVHGTIASGYAATREDALAIAQELAGSDPLELVDERRSNRT
jgi:hypothetical protein